LGTLSNIAIQIYFAHELTKALNGDYINFSMRLITFSTIGSAGLAVMAYTYNASTIRYLLLQLPRVYYGYYILFLIGITLLFVYFLQIGAPQQFSFGNYIITGFFFVAYVLNVVLDSILMVFRQFKFLLIIAVLYTISFCFIHYNIASKGYNTIDLIYNLSYLVWAKLILYILYYRSVYLKINPNTASIIHIRRIKALWLQIFLFDTAQIIFRFLDKFLVSFLVISELSAVYYNGTVDIPFLPVVFSAVNSAALLELSHKKRKNKPLSIHTIRSSSVLLATITLPIFFYLFVYRAEFINFVFSEKYTASIPIFACALLRLPAYLLNIPFYLQHRQRGDLLNKGTLLDIVLTLILIYPMYLWVGLPGIVLSFIISTYVQLAYYTYWVCKLLNTTITALFPLQNWMVKIITFSSISLSLRYVTNTYCSNTLGLILAGIIIGILALIWLIIEQKRARLVNFVA
jgi:O-antigen/teichoic acid export membrane protein